MSWSELNLLTRQLICTPTGSTDLRIEHALRVIYWTFVLADLVAFKVCTEVRIRAEAGGLRSHNPSKTMNYGQNTPPLESIELPHRPPSPLVCMTVFMR